jgi:hypothetical protein
LLGEARRLSHESPVKASDRREDARRASCRWGKYLFLRVNFKCSF